MRVVLVRHCETDYNRQGRVQGRSDAPLNEHGRLQAVRLAERLRDRGIDAVYSSPLRRALETAEPIAASSGLEVCREESLIELDAGEMDGLTGAEMRERFPGFMRAWLAGPDGGIPLPGGESLGQLQERAWNFVEQLRDRGDIEAAACVTHNFVVKAIVARAVRLPLANISRMQPALGSISIIEFRNQRVQVMKLNETCHLVDI